MKPLTVRFARNELDKLLRTAAVQRGVLMLALALSTTPCLHGQPVAWVRQFAYAGDFAAGVATGPGNSVYVAGLTYGNLDGQHGVGWDNPWGDAFLTKSDSTGYNYGSRQLGSSWQEISYGVAADQLGNVFIAGTTEGPMFSSFKGGILDGFFAKFNGETGGTLVQSQIGSDKSDECRDVAADGLGNGYVVGFTSGVLGASNLGGTDAFVIKSAASGPGWTQQFGTGGDDQGLGIAADALGNIFVAGHTTGNLDGDNAGGRDAFVTKFDPTGSLQWSRQLGTGTDEEALAAATDGQGNVFIAGYTTGDLYDTNAGGRDAFLTKYDSTGSVLWSRQFGTGDDDQAAGVTLDGIGNVFLSGYTSGDLGGDNAGGRDAFVTKFSDHGELRWTRQFGTTSDDEGFGVAADGQRNIYVSGRTTGGMHILSPNFNGNGGNAFFVKLIDPAIPGDYNDNGIVDAADYAVWRNSVGGATLTNRGVNISGPIDQRDYNVWKSNFGNVAAGLASGAGLSSVSAPEPSAMLLMGIGLAGLIASRWPQGR